MNVWWFNIFFSGYTCTFTVFLNDVLNDVPSWQYNYNTNWKTCSWYMGNLALDKRSKTMHDDICNLNHCRVPYLQNLLQLYQLSPSVEPKIFPGAFNFPWRGKKNTPYFFHLCLILVKIWSLVQSKIKPFNWRQHAVKYSPSFFPANRAPRQTSVTIMKSFPGLAQMDQWGSSTKEHSARALAIMPNRQKHIILCYILMSELLYCLHYSIYK